MLLTLIASERMSRPLGLVGSLAVCRLGSPPEGAACTDRSGYRYRAAAIAVAADDPTQAVEPVMPTPN